MNGQAIESLARRVGGLSGPLNEPILPGDVNEEQREKRLGR